MPKRKDPTTPLGELVRSERMAKHRDWTQDELAAKAGIPRQAVTDMEVGPPTRKVPMDRVIAVARAMGVPALRFLAVATPGEIEGEMVTAADLTLDEQDLIAAVRLLSPAERKRLRAYVQLAQEYGQGEPQ